MLFADIITIGDEILIGQIVDTNSAWMAAQLDAAGVTIRQITSISDRKEAITVSLREASQKSNIVLVTGGLGPTKDDVTKATLADYFQCGLRLDAEVLRHVESIFARTGNAMPPINRKQAEVLDRAEVLFNASGTAPGMYVFYESTHYFIMPGVPSEMQHLMQTHVLPRILQMTDRSAIYHRTILTAGLGESFLADKIADIETNLDPAWHLAYLPAFGQVRLRLSASGADPDILHTQAEGYLQRLRERLHEHWVSDDGSSLVETVLKVMASGGLSLSTAESCTGGHIASLITQIPGCSSVFKGGAVAYSNALKQSILSVPEPVLNRYGAVSRETAVAMAEGARTNFESDYAIASTGIAGPDGGDKDNPVGTVWLAVAGERETQARRFQFSPFRQTTIERASIQSFTLLKSILFKEIS